MKERPILFSGAMVRALLDGSKTQTRRGFSTHMVELMRFAAQAGEVSHFIDQGFMEQNDGSYVIDFCPFGHPGDQLWVRETFYAYGRWETRYSEKKKRDEWHFIDMTAECDRAYQYAADNLDMPLAIGRGGALPGWYKRPAIFMQRAASRIQLEITSIHVERLNDISEADAQAEGIFFTDYGRKCGHQGGGWKEIGNCSAPIETHPQRDGWMWDKTTGPDQCLGSARSAYMNLWELINGAGSWAANPFVWAIEFKRVKP